MASLRQKQSLAEGQELRSVHYSSRVIDSAMSDNTLGRFDRFARWIERQVGSLITFVMAIAIVLIWAISGPFFGWSDTWQLVINTGTSIVTFLMVFLIQSTQSRDTRALHLKLDELIRVNQAARNSLLNLEDMSEAEIQEVKKTFDRVIPASVERR
jgi:low affinity Fe/Cu permease